MPKTVFDIIERAALVEAMFHISRHRVRLAAILHAIQSGPWPMDLDRLATARNLDFRHDLAGIWNNYDIETGTYAGNWSPRHTIPLKTSKAS